MKINLYDMNVNRKKNRFEIIKEKGINYEGKTSDNPESIAEFMNNVFKLNEKGEEHLYTIAFDTRMNILGVFFVAKGNVNSGIVDPRGIFSRLLMLGAVSFIAVHNHPSGSIEPSREDINVTKRLKECGELLNVKILDHIIIANNKYCSMREHCF